MILLLFIKLLLLVLFIFKTIRIHYFINILIVINIFIKDFLNRIIIIIIGNVFIKMNINNKKTIFGIIYSV